MPAIADEELYDKAMEMIANVTGSGWISFPSVMNGEKPPLWNADARGNFSGINMLQLKEHFCVPFWKAFV